MGGLKAECGKRSGGDEGEVWEKEWGSGCTSLNFQRGTTGIALGKGEKEGIEGEDRTLGEGKDERESNLNKGVLGGKISKGGAGVSSGVCKKGGGYGNSSGNKGQC